jgi:hypothetical protein
MSATAPAGEDPILGEEETDEKSPAFILPMVFQRGSRRDPIDDEFRPERKDRVWFAILQEKRELAIEWLERGGWTRRDPGHA